MYFFIHDGHDFGIKIVSKSEHIFPRFRHPAFQFMRLRLDFLSHKLGMIEVWLRRHYVAKIMTDLCAKLY